MSEDFLIEDAEEYFEEEICGLSTIWEDDNESRTSSSSSSSSTQRESSSGKGPLSPRVPVQINLTPEGHYGGSVESSRRILALVSPILFSPKADARKLKTSSFKSPLTGTRPKGACSPSPSGRRRMPLTLATMPLVLTNLETGEEVVWDCDDDEYTLVSCSDNDSVLGGSFSNFDDGVGRLDCGLDAQSSLKHEFTWDDATPTPTTHYETDFELAKKCLQIALERRLKTGRTGKLRTERMDFMRRKLTYELQRKMLKAELNQCLIPTKRKHDN